MRTSLAVVLALATPAFASKPPVRKPAGQARIMQQPRSTRAPQKVAYPSVSIFGAHVGEALAYRPFDGKGRVRRDAKAELEHLLRCRQTGQHHKVDPRLAEALYQVGLHYPGHRLEVFSGYRPKAFCDRSHSRHMSGSAVDFHVEGVDNKSLVEYLRKAFHPAGVGYYPRDPHVHFDLERAYDTFWVQAAPPAGDPGIDPKAGPLPRLDPEDDMPLHDIETVATTDSDTVEVTADPPTEDPLFDTTT